MRAYASIPKLWLKAAKVDREIYVISFASDLRGESNHRPAAVGAINETLTDLAPPVEAAMRYMVVAVSNVFHHIDKTQPVSLSGDGIVLYPPADPQGMLALHFSVVESDQKARDFGKLLGDIFSKASVKSALEQISELTSAVQGIPAAVLTNLMGAVVDSVGTVLAKNKDDILFGHNHSGLDFASYGGTASGAEYPVGNKKVECVLRIYARD